MPSSQARNTFRPAEHEASHDSPLTSLHKRTWPIVTALGAAFVAVAVAGFKLGGVLSSAETAGKQLTSQALAEQAQTKLIAALERNTTLQTAIDKLTKENAQLNQQVVDQSAKLSTLSSQIVSEGNCGFIRQQILALEAERRAVGNTGFFGSKSSAEIKAEEDNEKEQRAALDKKIAMYQAQLGPGACK